MKILVSYTENPKGVTHARIVDELSWFPPSELLQMVKRAPFEIENSPVPTNYLNSDLLAWAIVTNASGIGTPPQVAAPVFTFPNYQSFGQWAVTTNCDLALQYDDDCAGTWGEFTWEEFLRCHQ